MGIEAAVVSAIATVVGTTAAVAQGVSTYKASQASKKAEALRRRQMQFDMMKRRRDSIRQALVAQSMARARGIAQGVGEGSSALFGADAQITGELGRQTGYTNASEIIGNQLFEQNEAQAQYQGMSALFGQVGNFAGGIVKNADTIHAVGQQLFGQTTANQTASEWESWYNGG